MKPRVRPVPVWLQRLRERERARLLWRMGDMRPGGVTHLNAGDYARQARAILDLQPSFIVNWGRQLT